MKISEIKRDVPHSFTTATQQKIYETLLKSGISWTRVDNEAAITVDDCEEISRRLGAPTVKTLLVANRQLTKFYMVVMPGHKPFVTKDFTAALGVSRVSFVKPELLDTMLGLEVGACTPLAIVADTEQKIRLVIDREAVAQPGMLLPDGTTTCYMNIASSGLLENYLPLTGHAPELVEM